MCEGAYACIKHVCYCALQFVFVLHTYCWRNKSKDMFKILLCCILCLCVYIQRYILYTYIYRQMCFMVLCVLGMGVGLVWLYIMCPVCVEWGGDALTWRYVCDCSLGVICVVCTWEMIFLMHRYMHIHNHWFLGPQTLVSDVLSRALNHFCPVG